jgi:hypothetical protein
LHEEPNHIPCEKTGKERKSLQLLVPVRENQRDSAGAIGGNPKELVQVVQGTHWLTEIIPLAIECE